MITSFSERDCPDPHIREQPDCKQHFLLVGPALAEVVAAELLGQFLIAAENPPAPLDLLLVREPAAAFTHRLERMAGIHGPHSASLPAGDWKAVPVERSEITRMG